MIILLPIFPATVVPLRTGETIPVTAAALPGHLLETVSHDESHLRTCMRAATGVARRKIPRWAGGLASLQV